MTATCSKPKRKSKKTKSNTNLPKVCRHAHNYMIACGLDVEEAQETKTDAPVKEAADASEAKADVPSAVTLSEGDFEIIKAVLASVHQRIAVKHCNTLSDTLATLKERLDRIETAVQAAQRDFGTLRNLIHCIANKAAGEVVERLQEAEAADGSLVAESENPEPASTDDPAVPTVVVTPPPATKIDGGVESEDSEVDGGLHFEA